MEPIIPKRPVKKSTPSVIEGDSPAIEDVKLESPTTTSIPIIPSRPRPKKATISDSESTKLEVESNEVTPKPEEIEPRSSDKESRASIPDSESIVSDEPLKDGEKTPGNSNSKTSFKDVDDELSFDDGETIKTEPTNVEEVNQFLENELQENDLIDETEDVKKDETKEEGEIESESGDTVLTSGKDNGVDSSNTVSVVEESGKDVEEEDTNKVDAEHEDVKPEGNEEQVAEVEEPNQVESSEIKADLDSPSEKKVEDQAPVVLDDTNKVETETSAPYPIIPTRPKKVKEPSSEDVANESTKDSSPSIPARPNKVPPPKPKKLSSKIAAFQQLLNNEPEPPKPAPKPKSDTRGKLSSSHMKFAQNLQGIMGKGIPLPGMVDPRLRSNESLVDVQDTEDDKTTDETTQAADVADSKEDNKPVRRAKGPKGKRLPKSLSTPVNIETSNKFKIVTGDLWTVEVKPPVEKEETPEPNEEEDSQSPVVETKDISNDESITHNEENEDTYAQPIVEDEPEQPKPNDLKTLEPEEEDIAEKEPTKLEEIKDLDEEFDFGTTAQDEPEVDKIETHPESSEANEPSPADPIKDLVSEADSKPSTQDD